LQGTYVGKTTLIKALAFGGTENLSVLERLEDLDILKNDRTFNAGIYTDEFGKLVLR
jgi:iron complex outermembrane receptor protein